MSETSKMIKLINKNKQLKQEENRLIKIQELKRQEKITNIKILAKCIIATYIFVQIVTLLVK